MTEIGRVIAHHAAHENGGSDEIDLSGLSGQAVFVPCSVILGVVSEDDTDKHTLDLAAALSESRTILALVTGATRLSGAGYWVVYPNEEGYGSLWSQYNTYNTLYGVKSGTNRMMYSQTVANDSFEVYCFGYFVEE